MNVDYLECNRLRQESNNALRSHAEILGRICRAGKDSDTVTQLKQEPNAREAADRRKGARRAFDDHQAKHNKEESDRAYPAGR